ncbi:MAG: CBS domain-containing protein [Candidatus Brocadia sp. AMX2]|nr:MAG: CBS domain-containing protein [Candidatus Brocadia sp. AMX2]MBC6932231.1 CBS domain-containing protein [Candidatus Brocadia sp.]MBL1168503.1 CBS domain-containing protein [Candidatus Brocadia sp. AMX1]MCE7867775.1 CBS domain-containing protein [Candidatus Brocadia sp. AMX2]MCQ3917326.1 CBS domain-containing protein [Candidatus Brocadia sp.]
MGGTIVATYKFVAKDLMAEKVVCVHPETPINDLIKILVKNHINGAPVVDKKRKLVGVVSKTDIVEYDEKTSKKRGGATKKSFYSDTNGKLKKELDKLLKTKTFGKTFVKDIMTSRVITAQANDTIDRLAKIMHDKKIHRVIIQDKEQVIGVVSTLDILHAVSTMGYGSSAFVTEEAILDLQERLEAAENSILSLRDILDRIHGEK